MADTDKTATELPANRVVGGAERERILAARHAALQHCVNVVISANKESAQKALVAVEDVLGVAKSMADFLLDGTVPTKKFKR